MRCPKAPHHRIRITATRITATHTACTHASVTGAHTRSHACFTTRIHAGSRWILRKGNPHADGAGGGQGNSNDFSG